MQSKEIKTSEEVKKHKQDCYELATMKSLGNNPQGTRMDVVFLSMDIYNESLLNQIDRLKREYESLTKELEEAKEEKENILKALKAVDKNCDELKEENKCWRQDYSDLQNKNIAIVEESKRMREALEQSPEYGFQGPNKIFSKDYSGLYKWLKQNPREPVLCFVNYKKKLDGSFFRDPAHIRYFNEGVGKFNIGSRGYGYEPLELFGNSEPISESVFCKSLEIIDLEYVKSMIE